MNTTEETGRTPSERRAGRRYMWEFAIGMVLLMFSFMVVPRLIQAEPRSVLSIVIVLIPILPQIWIVVAVIRHMRRMDERDRQMQFQSMSVGFGTSMLVAVTAGFLSLAGFDSPFLPWAVYLGGMGAWALSLVVLYYRANK